ncbi:olfactory receptor 7A17-like [Prionailurus viverrinus]|uniref:olfactory receptor 7A17-like n=1 Tax=Prionailurus viverrinus TaxID=61388 RepID=UPI001FF6DBCC|nr:olfactory receptor 7A17-like [Prionailurus viverrinus]
MEPGNDSQISELFLLGLSKESELQLLIFGLFLSMYLITVFGNLLILLAVSSDSHLHTPMYFFLANLSFVDICFTSTTVPKMLWNIQTQSKVITYAGCITQMYFFLLFAGLDNFLLSVMAYDRFMAICQPLHYTLIMKPTYSGLLVLVSWMMSTLNSLLQTLMMLCLSFYPDMVNPKLEETWFLHLDSSAWLECFTPSCSGNTASLSIINQQEGIQTSTWRRSSHRPHPDEAQSSAGISGKVQRDW